MPQRQFPQLYLFDLQRALRMQPLPGGGLFCRTEEAEAVIVQRWVENLIERVRAERGGRKLEAEVAFCDGTTAAPEAHVAMHSQIFANFDFEAREVRGVGRDGNDASAQRNRGIELSRLPLQLVDGGRACEGWHHEFPPCAADGEIALHGSIGCGLDGTKPESIGQSQNALQAEGSLQM